jgi:hypothetical protein
MKIADLYQHVTNGIISDLEKGVASWVKPWKNGNGGGVMPTNAVTTRAYSGINIPILWQAAIARGYPTQQWMTYKQALPLDAELRAAPHPGHAVIFALWASPGVRHVGGVALNQTHRNVLQPLWRPRQGNSGGSEGAESTRTDIGMVLPVRIELTTSPLPRGCSTTELRQPRGLTLPRGIISHRNAAATAAFLATRPERAQARVAPGGRTSAQRAIRHPRRGRRVMPHRR